jgi:hypothetical protein
MPLGWHPVIVRQGNIMTRVSHPIHESQGGISKRSFEQVILDNNDLPSDTIALLLNLQAVHFRVSRQVRTASAQHGSARVKVFNRVVHANSQVAAWHASLQQSTRARVHPDKSQSTESALANTRWAGGLN